MYVWGRLAWMAATSKRRGLFRFGDESRLSFRCLPHDIDRNMHLNNARYMMLADVGRIDIFLRSGFWALCSRNGWGPMMGGLQSAYVREIKLWKTFEIVSTIETWTDRQMIGRHRFVADDGRTAAMVLTTAGVYDRGGRRFVPIQEVVDQLSPGLQPRSLTPEEDAFVTSHAGVRELGKGEG